MTVPIPPQEAVEAAAKAMRRVLLGDRPELTAVSLWQDYIKDVEAALAAALPVLLEPARKLLYEATPSAMHGGGWHNGIVGVDEMCDALGIARPDPTPPPLTADEEREIRAAIDEIRVARGGSDGG